MVAILEKQQCVQSIYSPACSQREAHRALELLEDYHAKLTRPQDKQLRLAIERVIRIFKSKLFQALLVTEIKYNNLAEITKTAEFAQQHVEVKRLEYRKSPDGVNPIPTN
ncbi:hypothetical protein PV327_000574 [Microctonus hyperodae]|uniref:L27 domain-containing protein n=1 Tax=Microctonus hyperodae TaxID=165561 RepID=A0AA39G6G6_MICHY|nr:hypothetical protein PV327_000574 [Microctonus hyperodae]